MPHHALKSRFHLLNLSDFSLKILVLGKKYLLNWTPMIFSYLISFRIFTLMVNTKIWLWSKQIDDAREYKHTKNKHSKNIIKYQKFKFRENMSNLRKRWNTLKEVTPTEDSTPTEINHKGQTLTSSKIIANKLCDG